MKTKLLIIASVVAALSSSSAFAKTEGNYATLSVLRASTENNYKNQDPAQVPMSKLKDSSVGVGLDYKYAFNFNNFFVAPGVFVEKIGTEAKDSYYDEKDNINNRYGIKADLGYDVTDNFAVYFTNGFAAVSYKITSLMEDEDTGETEYWAKKSNQWGYFYGLGLGYNLNKQLAFNFEYNTQKVDLRAVSDNQKIDSRTNLFKLGVSYRF